MAALAIDHEALLAEAVAEYYADPLGFVLFAFPWGQPGPLKDEPGPDANQREFLTSLGQEIKARKFNGRDSVAPIRMAMSSGHGTGKSTMGAWLACFILSTRPHSIGTVTAGTAMQLESRTWSAIQLWMGRCITRHWFEVMAAGVYHREHSESWKLVAQTCREENAQSFAGQHASTSTSWYLFDEASTVPDAIWEVARGGLTDGEPMIFAWGQPERNSGQFYEVCFGDERKRWNHRSVDSRSGSKTNKATIEEWLQDYGEDSDWFRVRVRGLSPRADELQYIDKDRIDAARDRDADALPSDPLVIGVDVSGGGSAWTVARYRRGIDARSIPPIKINGEQSRDREYLIQRLAQLLSDPRRPVAAMFIDAAFGSPIVERLRLLGFQQVMEVNFGGKSPDIHCLNMRAHMHKCMKDWLLRGCIDKQDEQLRRDLTAAGYKIDRGGRLVIESKAEVAKRLGRSPDDSDALALTFAQIVAPAALEFQGYGGSSYGSSSDGWMA